MKLLLPAIAAAISVASPAAAQMASMPGMDMPAKPAAKPKPKPKPKAVPVRAVKPATNAAKPRAKLRSPTTARTKAKAQPAAASMDHDMDAMPGMAMPNAAQPAAKPGMAAMPGMDMNAPAEPTSNPTADHAMAAMPGMASTEGEAGNEPAPPPPTDHAAEAFFAPAELAQSRAEMAKEMGGATFHNVLFSLAEVQVRKGANSYRWDGEAWFGGDINRFVVKSEGRGDFRGKTGEAEVQALYSHAIGPYFNLQGGVRYDIRPTPSRGYATIGIEGLAPYMFEVGGALFLSDKGDLLARAEGYYDQRITQRLILQPRVELNFAAQDVRVNGIGAGLSDIELGLRLRYELKREFAPYIGVSYDSKVGNSAQFARIDGERVSAVSFVFGFRTWF
jgi:copper resistance protein B